MVAVAGGRAPGPIYASTNTGSSWFQGNAPNTNWSSVASSADGTKLFAVVGLFGLGSLYISTDGGANWNPVSGTVKNWGAIASSADGTKLVAIDRNDQQILTSLDSGASWTPSGAPTAIWISVASSADGNTLIGAKYQGGLYTSTNSGITWKTNNVPDAVWNCVSASADGNELAAAIDGDGIYVWHSGVSFVPTLSYSGSSNKLLLSWSYFAAEDVVQQNSDLKTGNWTGIDSTPIITNQQCQVQLPISGGSQFFRLSDY
jgi:hypothetical protein